MIQVQENRLISVSSKSNSLQKTVCYSAAAALKNVFAKIKTGVVDKFCQFSIDWHLLKVSSSLLYI
jgi:hypothetical protein